MPSDPILDEVNLVTLKEVFPHVIEDNFFLDTPFQARLRAKALVPFKGGSHMQTTFLYAPMIGGAYAVGDSFNITKRQTLAGAIFDPKYYEVAVPEFLEVLEVTNKGPEAVFKLLDIDLRNAMNTISAIIAIDMARHGQTAVTGVAASRPKNLNGWVEAMNDGLTNDWNGDYFTSYGTQARNGQIRSALNSVPFWAGAASGASGPITYSILEESYQDCVRGRVEPDLGVGNKAVIAYIKERMQPAQRFAQERDPYFGMSGVKFNNALIMKDDYFPSLKYGANDPDLGNYLTSTFISAASPGSTSNMPASTVLTVGEVFCWFNTSKWLFRVSDSKQYGFGFSGFIPAQDNTRVVGHIKAAVALECTAPWANKLIFGIGS